MFKHTTALLLTAVAVAACGEDDRLTKQQVSAKLQPQVDKVIAEFGAVFQTIADSEREVKEAAPVPEAALEKARAAVATERAAAREIASLRPPETLEDDLGEFVAAARAQASEIESTVAQTPSVAELADVMEGGSMRAALGALADAGVLQLPKN